MVDLGKRAKATDICSAAASDTRKVPIGIWVRETKPIIERLTSWQHEKKAAFAAFGATALGALGYSRSTKDVELVVKAGEWAFDYLAQELAKDFGFTKCPGGINKVLTLVKEIEGYHYVIELWDDYIYVMDCDGEMWKRVAVGQSLGFPLATLSVEDLASSKLGRFFVEHKREDIMDIAFLLKDYGIKDFDYFVQRIRKIKRGGQTIDDFLFEEVTALSTILGTEETTRLHSEIVNRKLYRQLLDRIMFKLAKESKNVDELADKTFLYRKDVKSILAKLGIAETGSGFSIPKSPNSIITALVNYHGLKPRGMFDML